MPDAPEERDAVARTIARGTEVRDRAIARMKLLVGATAALGPGCSSQPAQQPETAKAPPLFTTEPSEQPPLGPPGGLGTAPEPPSTGPDPGYMVVDMMPEPSRCSTDGAAIIKPTATVQKRADGKLEIILKFAPPPGSMLFQPNEVSAEDGGASFGKPDVVPDDRGLVVRSVITGPEPHLRIFLPLNCGPERGMIVASMSWDGKPLKAGDVLPVEVSALR